jgi:hypothetical protein
MVACSDSIRPPATRCLFVPAANRSPPCSTSTGTGTDAAADLILSEAYPYLSDPHLHSLPLPALDIVCFYLHGFVAFASWRRRLLALKWRLCGYEAHRSGALTSTAVVWSPNEVRNHWTAARNEGRESPFLPQTCRVAVGHESTTAGILLRHEEKKRSTQRVACTWHALCSTQPANGIYQAPLN